MSDPKKVKAWLIALWIALAFLTVVVCLTIAYLHGGW